MSNETPVPRELRDVLAVFTFFDKMIIVQDSGEVHELPRNTVPGLPAPALPDKTHPDVKTAILQNQEGAIKLAVAGAPDIFLEAGHVRSILMELCARAPGIVGEIYRAQTGIKPDAPAAAGYPDAPAGKPRRQGRSSGS